METPGRCELCEKIVVTLQITSPVESLLKLPNTYNSSSRKYEWRFHEFMAYTLIPRAVENQTAIVDMYLCIDEDDLDDIDVRGYAEKFLREHILPHWKNFSKARVLEPVLAPPEIVDCRKSRLHAGMRGRRAGMN